MTRKAPARYHAPVPINVLSLHELVDIVEQIFTIAATCDLRDVMSDLRTGGRPSTVIGPRMASPPPDCATRCARALARAAAGIGSSSVRGRSDMTMLLTKPNLPQPAANWSVPTRRAELGQYARVACKLRSHTQKVCAYGGSLNSVQVS